MRIKRTTTLSATEKHQLMGWGDDIFQSEVLQLIWRPKQDHFVLFDNDVAVSHCGVIRQTVMVDNVAFAVGGIGSVVTHPHYQGHGYARQVLNEAMTFLRGEHLKAALLFCREGLVPYYQRLDWLRLSNPVQVLQPTGPITFPAATMVYPFTGTWPPGPVTIDSPPW